MYTVACKHAVYVCKHVVYVCKHVVYVCKHVMYVCKLVMYACNSFVLNACCVVSHVFAVWCRMCMEPDVACGSLYGVACAWSLMWHVARSPGTPDDGRVSIG